MGREHREHLRESCQGPLRSFTSTKWSRNKPARTVLLGALFFLLATSCGADTEVASPDISEPSDLRSRLAKGVVFDVTENIEDFAEAEAAALRSEQAQAIDFEIVAGDFEVSANNSSQGVSELTLSAIHVELGEVFVPPEFFPPNGIELTDIALALKEPMTASAFWSADKRSVGAEFSASLVLHWSVLRDGRPVPLADIVVPAVPLTMTLHTDGGLDRISLSATHPGSFWRWAETFEFRDLAVALTGSAG